MTGMGRALEVLHHDGGGGGFDWFTVVILVLIVAALAGLGYWLWLRNQ